MRILLINKYHRAYAGPERLYFDTAKMLERAGHQVAFFSMAHPKNEATPWAKYFAPEVEYEGQQELSLWQKLRMAQNIIFNFRAKKNLEALIKEFQPDAAHLFNIYHQLSPSIIWALKKHHVPIVMTLCDYKLASPNYNLFVRGKIWHHGSGLRCIADRCVKDSYLKSFVCAMEQWFHRFLGTFGQVNVYIGLSQFLIDTFKSLEFPYPIRLIPQALYPFPDTETPLPPVTGKNFLYFGRLSAEKGVATIIRAMSELSSGEKLQIVGFGPEEERLKTLTAELHLGDRVSFLGPVYGKPMAELITEARAVIVSSEWYENTPYALIESLAQGTLVIAARSGSLPERVLDGENGFLYEPGDAHGLAQKMRQVAGLENLDVVRENARRSIASLHPDTYFTKLLALYKSLI